VLLQSPGASPPADRATSSPRQEKPARFLVSDSFAHFGAYKGLPGFANPPTASSTASIDPASTYETVVGRLDVRLT
jgi:hypothetical protein